MKQYRILDAILVGIVSYHIILSPFTKVEESFNIQAIHDILNFGIFPQQTILTNYDHIEFPGVVPRTFLGSLLLAGITKVMLIFNSILGIEYMNGSQLELQSLVRGILGISNVLSLIYIRECYKKKVGVWYGILLISQFHLLYYSSRTLPNFICLPFVNYSIGKLLKQDLKGLMWLGFIGIVFRLEVGVFAVIVSLVSLVFRQYEPSHVMFYLVAGTLIGGLVSLVVDSYFWGTLIIPELQSFVFNIIQGKSSNWGVEPFGSYFNKYLVQLFRPPIILLLIIPGFFKTSKSLKVLFISSILFIIAMSFQPHKEWRFIIYVVPIFTLQAANGVGNIAKRTSLLNRGLLLLVLGGIALSTILSLQIGYISSFNYPGGYALQYVNTYIVDNNLTDFKVHMDVPACMTGVTKFGELHNYPIVYDKTEKLTSLTGFDMVITHEKLEDGWELIQSIDSFVGLNVSLLRKFTKESFLLLIKNVLNELIVGSFETWLEFFRSLVVTGDYLYIYKAVQSVEE
ncbi:Dol-P-Man:Man [Spathaspora sp. JA1]|nr:Dol-P-Man:Man [Spathaspora sp. JA1]